MIPIEFIYSLLGTPLGYIMRFLYLGVNNFGWAVILFTIVVKAASFPLALKQQKNMAISQLFTPRVQEIQKKYRGNQAKMQEEMGKLQKEGYNPVGGCGPMILTMIILFGVIDVVYKPMTHMERFDEPSRAAVQEMAIQSEYTNIIVEGVDENVIIELFGSGNIGSAVFNNLSVYTGADSPFADDIKKALGSVPNNYRGLPRELRAVNQYAENPDAFSSLDGATLEKLDNLSHNMVFLGSMNLGRTPRPTNFDGGLWILAVSCFLLSVAQIILQQFIQKKSMPANTPNMPGMKMMLVMGPVFSLFIVFVVPAGAGLYWFVSYLFMIAQSVIIYKFWPPHRLREEAKAKANLRISETVVTTTATTEDAETEDTVEKTTTLSEMSSKEQKEYFRKKLEAARKADLEKYGDESHLILDDNNNDKGET